MTVPKKEQPGSNTTARKAEEELDRQLKDSFPASDPPSYSGGSVGAPKARESDAATSGSRSVVAAEKKVKSGDAKKPDTY
jgi:hypothetical protein